MLTDDSERDRKMGGIRRYHRMALLLPATVALSLAVATPLGASEADARTVLTSLGATREDGTPLGVVGGHERFRLQAPPGKVFREIAWKIEGAIDKQEIKEFLGFANTPLPDPFVVRPPGKATESIVEFYWDAAGGQHSIRVTARYTDGTVGTPEGFSPPSED